MLIAALAVKTGLTGRAFAVDAHERVGYAAAAAIAAREGALVETVDQRLEDAPARHRHRFDVACVRDVLARPRCRRAQRVSRARCAACSAPAAGAWSSTAKRAWARRGGGRTDRRLLITRVAEDAACGRSHAEGFKAARILAERDGSGSPKRSSRTPSASWKLGSWQLPFTSHTSGVARRRSRSSPR